MPLFKHSFQVEFNDGRSGIFQLANYLEGKRGPLLEPLSDPEYVGRAFVDGGALAWPNGLELSLQSLRAHLFDQRG
jgi:hypothetical protein